MANKIVEVNELKTFFETKKGIVKAVNGVTFDIHEGKTLGIVGESGSGKSVTAMSVVRLLESNGFIESGSIMYDGKDLAVAEETELLKIRGNDISYIFQEPMTSLNPVFRVGRQIGEALRLHRNMTKEEARATSIKMLEAVYIPRADQVIDNYPFQLSGGMRQRVMIAMALACEPKLLIADEPTTALDVTIQAQILKLMNDLKKRFNTAILFITHDLGVINEMADQVAVMYCGQIVEYANVEEIFTDSKFSHPYRVGLLDSIPKINVNTERLEVIEGSVPHPLELPVGCKFAPRCRYATDKCHAEQPDLVTVNDNQKVRCFYPETLKRTGGKK